VEGLYAVGDVVVGINQISVATGQAAVAATDVHNQLPLSLRATIADRNAPGDGKSTASCDIG
jgi:thioredoxin reductase (NADPH)